MDANVVEMQYIQNPIARNGNLSSEIVYSNGKSGKNNGTLHTRSSNEIHVGQEEPDILYENSQTVEFEEEDKYFGNIRIKEKDEVFPDSFKDNSEVIVSMHNVHKTYLLGIEGVPALRGVSMSILKGEFVCIFGTSGGGKTTMLNIMGTIDKPTKGELRLCGTRVTSSTKDSELSLIRLKKVGFVFQTFNLLSSLSALENVEMPMILCGELSHENRRKRAIELLTTVGMGSRLHHLPTQLSGGEQQRVTIARAIANSPELLLLDEPTGDLDTVNTLIVMKLLTDLNQKEKITMVMVTHDVGLKNFADRILWMRDGKVQRTEIVPQWKREEAIRKVEEDLALALKKRETKSLQLTTEYRIPTDYHTHPKYVRRDIPSIASEKDDRQTVSIVDKINTYRDHEQNDPKGLDTIDNNGEESIDKKHIGTKKSDRLPEVPTAAFLLIDVDSDGILRKNQGEKGE